MRRALTALAAATLIAVAPVSAHHSFSAYYFEDQSVTLQGVIQEFQLRSPHATVIFTSPDGEGRSRTYSAEWSSPRRLTRNGVTKDTLKPGDAVIITGNPGRNQADHRVRLLTFKRPKDGWSWGILENETFN